MPKILDYRTNDMTNGEGVRVSVFVSGCSLKCKGCWNPESWNPNNGFKIGENFIQKVLEDCDKDYISGLSILGGEPTESLSLVTPLVKEFKRRFGKTKDIWVWSGFTFEELYENSAKMEFIKHCDVLIDGRFIQELRDTTLMFRGSENQRILDVQLSISHGKPVEYHV